MIMNIWNKCLINNFFFFFVSGLIRHFRPEIERRMKQYEEKRIRAKN